MKVISDEAMIQRNAKISQYTNLASLIILSAALYVTFAYQQLFYLSFTGLIAGFVLSQVSFYYGNRWGRVPRIDQQLNIALKGLSKEYNLYHYQTAVSHLLVGPPGIWIIEPYYQRGQITYENGRWKQKGGGVKLLWLKLFAQEGLGRPELEIKADIDNLTKSLSKSLGTDELPPINAALVFTSINVELQADGAPLPTMHLKELKDFLRKYAKQHPFPPEDVRRLTEALPQME